jgi:hypothetical protein
VASAWAPLCTCGYQLDYTWEVRFEMSERTLIVVIVLAVVILIAVAATVVRSARKRRSARLRSRFGPEYDRVVLEQGDAARAEAALEERERRSRTIIVRPLSAAEQERFVEAWRALQSQFVDDPGRAVTEADRLVEDLMSQRGYPVGNFELQAADISVDHPVVVQSYRSAHEIAERHRKRGAGTEDLREAMVHYRRLYDELLGPQTTVPAEVKG